MQRVRKFVERLRDWRAAVRVSRRRDRAERAFNHRWQRATPGEQIALLVDALHASPQLRRAFREALAGKRRG